MIELAAEAFSRLTWIEAVLLSFGFLLFLLRLIYMILFYVKIISSRKQPVKDKTPESLSLILTVRNEEENLKKYLPSILNSSSNGFEVVAVDDFSDDDSLIVLGQLKEQYRHLKVSSLSQETRYSVKLAQNIALKAAHNQWAMVIAPSIAVYEENWLNCTGSHTDDNLDVLVGYSNLKHNRKWINLVYRLENMFQQVKSFGFILNGLAFVYNEENVAFRKARYFESGGYRLNIREYYANLELIINSFIYKSNTRILFNTKSSFLYDTPVTFNDYLNLIHKHVRVEKRLAFAKKLVLNLEMLTGLVFLPYLIFLMIYLPEFWLVVAVPLVMLAIFYMVIIKIILNHLKEDNLFLPSLGYSLLIPYFRLFFRWYNNLLSHRQRWRSKI